MIQAVKNIPFFNIQNQSLFLISPLCLSVSNEAAHRHLYQEILWVREGEGVHTIDDHEYQLEKNTFYLIYKGQVHSFLEGKNLDGFLIRFNNEFLKEISPLERTLSQSVNIINKLTEEETVYFNIITKTLYREFTKDLPHKIATVRHLLMVLLYKLDEKKQELQRLHVAKNSDSEGSLYLKFIESLEKRYTTEAHIDVFAQELGILPRRLCDIIKNCSGRTTKQLIIDRRILEAKRLLVFTDKPLKEIAYGLGFEDTAYFCRTFKNYTDLTPTEFKKQSVFTF